MFYTKLLWEFLFMLPSVKDSTKLIGLYHLFSREKKHIQITKSLEKQVQKKKKSYICSEYVT